MRSGYVLKGAQVVGERVKIQFAHHDGSPLEVEADHVIAGTGYQVDLKRLPFLDDVLRSQIKLEGTSPALSKYFESSVPELYFVGLPSAVTFGPLTRFAFGAGFAAPRISSHLSRQRPAGAASQLSRAQP
jgi:hypothetical protein